jgi:serine phosphatase RsbU (regulator of sigma subunit)
MNAAPEHANEQEVIAARAFEKWRRRAHATPVEDWLDAETELQQLRESDRRESERQGPLTAATHRIAGHSPAYPEAQPGSLVAEAQQVAQRLAAERAVRYLLAESTHLADIAGQVLRAICERLNWDVGVLWLLDRDAGVFRCTDLWHAPTFRVSDVERDGRQPSPIWERSVPAGTWAQGRAAWTGAEALGSVFSGAVRAAEIGLDGAVAFPVHDGAELLGLLQFFGREIRQPDQELLDTMSSIGSHICQFIERRRAEQSLQQQQAERRLARQIQEGMLPHGAPVPAGLSAGGRSCPSNGVGGDYFDFFPTIDGRLALAIGDASGHGVGAALMIAATRAYVRALALATTDLGAILTQTNRRLAEDLPCEHFVTLFLAVLDPRARSLVHAGAGHCAGHVLDGEGHSKGILNADGLPLGVGSPRDFRTSLAIALAPGDVLFLHTDGLTDARASGGAEHFGLARALSVVRQCRRATPDDILDALFRNVAAFTHPQGQGDDIAAVIVKVDEHPDVLPMPVLLASTGFALERRSTPLRGRKVTP